MLRGLAVYVAQVLRPWLWPLCVVAASSFAVFLVTRLWVVGCGVRLAKRTRERQSAAGDHATGARISGAVVRGFVKSIALLSALSGKVSGAAASVACVAVLAAVVSSSPLGTSAVAGAAAPMLATAQKALQQAAPAAYAKASDLASPLVSKDGDSTVFTFSVAKGTGGKSAKAQTYKVTVGPDGVQVGATR